MYQNLMFRRQETVESVLQIARADKNWHEGTRKVMYEFYKTRIIRVAGRDIVKRDESIKELRQIFHMGH